MVKPYYQDSAVTIFCGDCREIVPTLGRFDLLLTDPPYGLKFMGKAWDYDVPDVDLWRVMFEAMKPGAQLFAFAGTRTQHRMAVNIEDAGFEIRDMISFLYSTNETMRQLVATMTPEQLKLMDATFGRDSMIGWAYGSGFPKSLDVGKSLDAAEKKRWLDVCKALDNADQSDILAAWKEYLRTASGAGLSFL